MMLSELIWAPSKSKGKGKGKGKGKRKRQGHGHAKAAQAIIGAESKPAGACGTTSIDIFSDLSKRSVDIYHEKEAGMLLKAGKAVRPELVWAAVSRSLMADGMALWAEGQQLHLAAAYKIQASLLLFADGRQGPKWFDVPGDGNCFLHAVHRGFFGGEGNNFMAPERDEIRALRESCVDVFGGEGVDLAAPMEVLACGLVRNKEEVLMGDARTNETFSEVVARLLQDGEFCERAMLYAASSLLKTIIVVFTSVGAPEVICAAGVSLGNPIVTLALFEVNQYQHFMLVKGLDVDRLRAYARRVIDGTPGGPELTTLVARIDIMFRDPAQTPEDDEEEEEQDMKKKENEEEEEKKETEVTDAGAAPVITPPAPPVVTKTPEEEKKDGAEIPPAAEPVVAAPSSAKPGGIVACSTMPAEGLLKMQKALDEAAMADGCGCLSLPNQQEEEQQEEEDGAAEQVEKEEDKEERPAIDEAKTALLKSLLAPTSTSTTTAIDAVPVSSSSAEEEAPTTTAPAIADADDAAACKRRARYLKKKMRKQRVKQLQREQQREQQPQQEAQAQPPSVVLAPSVTETPAAPVAVASPVGSPLSCAMGSPCTTNSACSSPEPLELDEAPVMATNDNDKPSLVDDDEDGLDKETAATVPVAEPAVTPASDMVAPAPSSPDATAEESSMPQEQQPQEQQQQQQPAAHRRLSSVASTRGGSGPRGPHDKRHQRLASSWQQEQQQQHQHFCSGSGSGYGSGYGSLYQPPQPQHHAAPYAQWQPDTAAYGSYYHEQQQQQQHHHHHVQQPAPVCWQQPQPPLQQQCYHAMAPPKTHAPGGLPDAFEPCSFPIVGFEVDYTGCYIPVYADAPQQPPPPPQPHYNAQAWGHHYYEQPAQRQHAQWGGPSHHHHHQHHQHHSYHGGW